MLTGLFRRNQPAALLLLLLLVPLLFPGGGYGLPYVQRPGQVVMPLYGLLRDAIGPHAWATTVFGILLTMGVSVQLAFLMNNAELVEGRNHMAALLLPLLLACAPQGLWPDPAFAGMPFVLWGLRRGWSMQEKNGGTGSLFDGGFLLGVAALFHLPYAFFVVVLWASTSVMRPFHWRDYVVATIGLALPLYLCWGLLRALGSPAWQPLDSLHTAMVNVPAVRGVPKAFSVMLVSVLALFALSTITAFSNDYRRSVMRGKNIRSAFLAFAFASGLLILFERTVRGTFPPIVLAVPLAALFSYPLLSARRSWLAEAGVWTLAVLALWARFGA